MPNCCRCRNYYHLNQLWDFEIDHAMYLTIDTTEAPEAAVTIKERMFYVYRMNGTVMEHKWGLYLCHTCTSEIIRASLFVSGALDDEIRDQIANKIGNQDVRPR